MCPQIVVVLKNIAPSRVFFAPGPAHQPRAESETSCSYRSSVNFTNILRAAFTLADPESVKKIDNLTVFSTLLGSARVKAVRRTLMKLSPCQCLRTRSSKNNFLFLFFPATSLRDLTGNRVEIQNFIRFS